MASRPHFCSPPVDALVNETWTCPVCLDLWISLPAEAKNGDLEWSQVTFGMGGVKRIMEALSET